MQERERERERERTSWHWLAVAAAMVLIAAGPTWAGWNIQTVDNNGDVGYPSLALDSNDNPRISYAVQNGSYGVLKYAAWNGSGWAIQTVDDSNGRFTSLQLDANGNPRIACLGWYSGLLKYAAMSGTSWDVQTVYSTASMGGISLALDQNGNPWISYRRNDGLWIATWNGSIWNPNAIQVDSDPQLGIDSKIVLDTSGSWHIAYGGYTGELKYADQNGLQTLDSGIGPRPFPSLALGSDGFPRIAYNDCEAGHVAGNLIYLRWDGTEWLKETVAVDIMNEASLALDPFDRPRISFQSEPDRDLKYAAWNGSSWDIQVVEEGSGEAGGDSCLALDSQGNPWITYLYWDGSSSALKLANIPEPATLSLLVLGGAAVMARRKRRK